MVHNIAKRHNVGTLARSATAFGVSELILVGRRDFNAFGSHGSTSHVSFRHFHSLSDARQFLKVREFCGFFFFFYKVFVFLVVLGLECEILKWVFVFQDKDCDICGVEITDTAVAVNQHPFKKSTAFLLGNEVWGFEFF